MAKNGFTAVSNYGRKSFMKLGPGAYVIKLFTAVITYGGKLLGFHCNILFLCYKQIWLQR